MDVLVVDLAGLGLIAWIVWYFFQARRTEAAAAASKGAIQEIEVTVRGGYIPATIAAQPGVPLRIRFRREETSACSEELVFRDFGIRRQLPAFETTTIEIPPSPPGTYEFACGMDMMHGRLVVGAKDAVASAGAALPVGGAEPPPSATAAELPVDPICGMRVDPDRAAATSVRDGDTIYFCSPGCKQRFDGGPA